MTSPGDEPALKASDKACEDSFESYLAEHVGLPRASYESAYVRRRAWIGWARGLSDEGVNDYLRPFARDLMRKHPGASRAQAYCFAAKQVVAIALCLRAGRVAA